MDENKILNLLEKIYIEVQETKSEVKSHTERLDIIDNRLDKIDDRLNTVDNRLDKIDNRLDKLETEVKEISNKVDNLTNKVSELDRLNAKRHIEILDKINRLSTDLNVFEAVSGKNLADIAILKLLNNN